MIHAGIASSTALLHNQTCFCLDLNAEAVADARDGYDVVPPYLTIGEKVSKKQDILCDVSLGMLAIRPQIRKELFLRYDAAIRANQQQEYSEQVLRNAFLRPTNENRSLLCVEDTSAESIVSIYIGSDVCRAHVGAHRVDYDTTQNGYSL
jgi:hypothetical protein